jgi:hypothetical protein
MILFTSFSNTSYSSMNRIRSEAVASGFFDAIFLQNEYTNQSFFQLHFKFISQNPQGFGLWIWKPQAILNALSVVKTGDIVVYCDAGFQINSDGLRRYREYLNIANYTDLVVFSMNDNYIAQHWVKRAAIEYYFPEFANKRDLYRYAGIGIFKKTENTLLILNEWRNLCEMYHFLDRKHGGRNFEGEHFRGHDCDMALFNLCLSKHEGCCHTVVPDEINIYNKNGEPVFQEDDGWHSLNDKPFHARRFTPRFNKRDGL